MKSVWGGGEGGGGRVESWFSFTISNMDGVFPSLPDTCSNICECSDVLLLFSCLIILSLNSLAFVSFLIGLMTGLDYM